MVCMGLRGFRVVYTKKRATTDPSPPGQPRARKINIKCVPTIHEESSCKAVLTKQPSLEQL